MNATRDQIKTFCHSIGFDLVGFIKPVKYQTYSQYRQWINDGFHGEMKYLSSDRSQNLRQSPRMLMPDCQTILVLAFRYHGDTLAVKNDPSLDPLIASYARGMDYHLFLPDLMHQIVAYIQQGSHQEITALCFTDSAPILEKELGFQAGLGWVGKNSCLIHPKIGSYFFLAEILLNVDIGGDEGAISEIADHCGKCRRCIDVCPTHCIQENRTLDASRCISYLTIENKGSIPDDLRSQIGNHLAGCDLCQQVCPWNNRESEKVEELPGHQQFMENIHTAVHEPIAQNETFEQYFKETPISRLKRHGFYRNLAVTMGNSPQSIKPSVIESLLKDPSSLVRRHALWALKNYPVDDSIAVLRSMLKEETDEEVIEQIHTLLKTKEAQK